MSTILWRSLHFGLVIIALSFIYIGTVNILYGYEKNRCTMTWMYEVPEYIPVSMSKKIRKQFPHYSLFVYGEGSYAEYLKAMESNLQLTGVPALFVHGNAGRYKQVRSLASISLRKSERLAYHFNYFSVDFDEELSGFYGPFLMRQTDFLLHALKRVFRCYSHLPKHLQPSSVIMIGHSMGGLAIRGLYSLPNFDPQTVSVIVTFATPYVEPPLMVDSQIAMFYKSINSAWNNLTQPQLNNITLLSLGGGFRDYLVRSDLCSVKETTPFHRYQITSSLPTIWLSTDHQCIVWCNELIRRTTKVFFQIIDPVSKQVSNNPQFRANIFKRLFFHESDIVPDFPHCKSMALSDGAIKHVSEDSAIECFKLITPRTFDKSFVLYVESKQLNWLFKCNENYVNCSSLDKVLIDASSSYAILRPMSGATYLLHLQRHNILMVKPLAKRSLNIFPQLSNGGQLNITFENQIEIFELHHVHEPWNTLSFRIQPLVPRSFDMKVVLFVPWSREITVKHFNNVSKIPFRFYSAKPHSENRSIQLLLVSNKPKSKVNIKVALHPENALGQMVRFNGNQILSVTLLFSFLIPLPSFFGPGFIPRNSFGMVIGVHIVYTVCEVLFDVLINNATLLSSLNHHFLPYIFVLITSVSFVSIIQVIASSIIKLLPILLFPIVKVFEILIANLPWLKYIMLPVFLSWYVKTVHIHFIIITQLLIHILSISSIKSSPWIKDKELYSKHVVYLQAILPMVLFATISPITIVTKQIIEHKKNYFIDDKFVWEEPSIFLLNPTISALYVFGAWHLYVLFWKYPKL